MRSQAIPLLLILPLLATGCLNPLTGDDGSPADVMVTHYPIYYLTTAIAGENVTVEAFIEGAPAHHHEPSFQDRVDFEEATLVIYQGAMFDPWIEAFVEATDEATPRTLELTETVHLIDHGAAHEEPKEHEHEGSDHDPHTWTDPRYMIEHALAIQDALTDTFPEHEQAFQERTDTLIDDLDELDTAYNEALAACEMRLVIVNHNAFAYLGERYNVTFEAVHGLSPDTEPSAQTIDRLTKLIEEHNLTTVFFEAFVNPDVIDTIARETGAETQRLSSLESISSDQRDAGHDYISLMEENLDKLSRAMRCAS